MAGGEGAMAKGRRGAQKSRSPPRLLQPPRRLVLPAARRRQDRTAGGDAAQGAAMATAGDPVKLQAQLHRLQAQFDEVVKEKDKIQKGARFSPRNARRASRCHRGLRAALAELARVKDLNAAGGAELRKAVGAWPEIAWRVRAQRHGRPPPATSHAAIINGSRDAAQLSAVTEERDVYQQQVRGLQDIVRGNLEELDRYRRHIAELERSAGAATPVPGSTPSASGEAAAAGGAGGGAGAGAGPAAPPSNARQSELQERLTKLRADLKEAERALAATTAAAAATAACERDGNAGGGVIPAAAGRRPAAATGSSSIDCVRSSHQAHGRRWAAEADAPLPLASLT